MVPAACSLWVTARSHPPTSLQGPGILGNKTFALQAALGARLLNDTFPACPAPAPYVLKACPGAPSSLACVPGSRPLTGLESGCCACRRTRPTVPVRRPAVHCSVGWWYGLGRVAGWALHSAVLPPYLHIWADKQPACLPPSSPCPQYTLVYPATPVANTYYETVPNCRKAVRALLGGTIVHYTGALVRGNPWLGCSQKKYAKVVLEVRPAFALLRVACGSHALKHSRVPARGSCRQGRAESWTRGRLGL